MMQLGLHLQNFEAEKQKLRTQVKRLCQENAWLRDELGSTQKKLHECEQTNASYAVEIEHLKFLKNIQQFDDTSFNSGNTADDHHQQQELVNDLFPFDDNEDDQQAENGKIFTSYNDLSMSTSHIASGSFLSSTGYEIPARLKTLHNLVIQYASQGRYEVAVPLCRQALADLEKSSGHQRKRNSKDVRLGILPGSLIDETRSDAKARSTFVLEENRCCYVTIMDFDISRRSRDMLLLPHQFESRKDSTAWLMCL